MTASAHYKAVYDWLDANTTYSPLEYGPLRQHFDDKVIAVRETGSGTVEGKFNGGSEHLKMPHVQVLVRETADRYDDGQNLARDIYDDLASADISGYASPRPLEPTPNELGDDADGRWLFSINLELQIDE